ncbi:hypothetical protein F4781DRAFT_400716 [Annulohypoxylon bovei var. microspora]|nr:hypothetical protein F4781DRAFT_400716 [Annulohypoxylon bovei var. microspora]
MDIPEENTTMAEEPGVQDDKLKTLSDELNAIDSELSNEFGNFEAVGFQDMPLYFINIYSKLIATLREISRELVKKEATQAEDVFNQAIGLLEKFYTFAEDNVDTLAKQTSIQHKLWTRLGYLSRFPFTSLNPDIGRHIRAMTALATSLIPTVDQVWSDGDIKPHKRFQRIFEDFKLLNTTPIENDADIHGIVFQSQEFLREAFLGLHIPLAVYDINLDLFDDNSRPTYVDFSCNSDEYLFGQGTRPGVLDFKSRLGGPITPEEAEGLQQAKEASKKRPAPPDVIAPPPKKARAPRGYTMDKKSLDADVSAIYEDAKLNIPGWVISFAGIVTPTAPNRLDTLENYRTEICKVLRRYRRDYYPPETPPATQADRDALITRLEHDIPLMRSYIAPKSVNVTGFSNIKDARVNAYGLKFMRTLLIGLLLSSTPPRSQDQISQALIERLDDWILFEQAWNAGDERSQVSLRLSVSKKSSYQTPIDMRNINIADWGELQKELREDMAGGNAAGPAAGNPEVSAEEEAEEEAEQPQEPEEGPEDIDPPSNRHFILQPMLPRRTIHANERDERQHLELRSSFAIDRVFGEREGGEHSKSSREKFSYENEIIAGLVNIFAEGGPPDHGEIPTTTVFEKLTYMIVLTHWRFFQAKDVLQLGTAYPG